MILFANPLEELCEELAEKIEELEAQAEQVRGQIDAHIPEAGAELEKAIGLLQRSIENGRDTVLALEQRRNELYEQYLAKANELDGINIFDRMLNIVPKGLRDQVQRSMRNLTACQEEVHREREAAIKAQEALEKHQADLSAWRALAEQRPALKAKLDQIEGELQVLRQEYLVANDRYAVLKNELGALEEKYQELAEQYENAAEMVQRALSYQERLTEAGDDRRWRRFIHKQCESEFGTGNPEKAEKEHRSSMAAAVRHMVKQKEEYQSAIRYATMVIDTVCLDGSNLCYSQEDKGSIGAGAVVRVANDLAQLYRVKVFFDAGILGVLRMDRKQLRKLFDDRVLVHIAEGNGKADPILLAEAAEENTWVISNDKFFDFPHVKAVKERRLVRFSITWEIVKIPDFKYEAKYEQGLFGRQGEVVDGEKV